MTVSWDPPRFVNEAFTAPIRLTNPGNFSVYDVHAVCRLVDVQFDSTGFPADLIEGSSRPATWVKVIKPRRTETTFCHFGVPAGATYQTAAVSIDVRFSTWLLPWTYEESSRFVEYRETDRGFEWFPKAE